MFLLIAILVQITFFSPTQMGKAKPMDDQFKALWAKQLYKEFERFNWLYKANLSKAVIEIKKLSQSYGTWDSFSSTITISEDLILTQTWEIVLEVLKHEMAHQMVFEIYKMHEHHGEYFGKACQILRVAPWARKATISQDEKFTNSVIPEKEAQLLRKIQKLLALSQSANENEALAAIEKVRELNQRYNLEQYQVREDSQYTSVFINHKKKRFQTYQTLIIALLVKHYNVDAVYSHLYCPEAKQEHRVVELLGQRQNISIAEYVYWFLNNNVISFWHDYQTALARPSTLKMKNQFLNGVIKGFDEKLTREKHKSEIAANSVKEALVLSQRDMVRQHKRELKEFVHYRHPRLNIRRQAGSGYGGEAFWAGLEKGKNLSLREGLRSKMKGQVPLLNASH